MIARKLVHALDKLDKKSLQRFTVFLNSPYFNVNVDIRRFYQLLLSSLLSKQKVKWATDEEIWHSLYPNVDLDKRKLNLLYFNLGNLFDEFLTQLEFEGMKLMQNKILMDGLIKLNNHELRNSIKEMSNQLIKMNLEYSSQVTVFQYFFSKNTSKNPIRNEIIKWLNLYFILEKLQVYINLLSWKKMYKLDTELLFMDYIFKKSTYKNYQEFPLVKVYTSITDILINEDDTELYYQLRKLMKEHIDNFSIEIQREMYSAALGYCIKKVNLSTKGFDKELFEVYKEFVERNLILTDNEMTASDFRNIVFSALRVKEFDWTEKFIEEKKVYVNPKFRDNAVYFSLARLEVNRENYDKVLDYLQLINYDDVWYQLGAKTMQLAAYYKLGEIDALESFLNAYKMYINREKSLTKERKTAYLNLIKYTKKLIYVVPHEKQKIQKLRNEIESTPSMVNKSWLLERVDELN